MTGALVAVGTLGGGAAVWAASAKPTPGPGDQINACAGRHGLLRLVHYADQCHGREFPISWNRQGPQGPPGPSLNTSPLQATQTGSPLDLTAQGFPITTWTAVPGLGFTLPSAGTYLLNANVRGILNFTSVGTHNCYISADLATGGTPTQVANSQRVVVVAIDAVTTLLNQQATAPIQMLVTTTADNTPVVVRAALVGTCPTSSSNHSIVTNADGASTLNAVRIN